MNQIREDAGTDTFCHLFSCGLSTYIYVQYLQKLAIEGVVYIGDCCRGRSLHVQVLAVEGGGGILVEGGVWRGDCCRGSSLQRILLSKQKIAV